MPSVCVVALGEDRTWLHSQMREGGGAGLVVGLGLRSGKGQCIDTTEAFCDCWSIHLWHAWFVWSCRFVETYHTTS